LWWILSAIYTTSWDANLHINLRVDRARIAHDDTSTG